MENNGLSGYPGSSLVDDEIVMIYFQRQIYKKIFTFNETSL